MEEAIGRLERYLRRRFGQSSTAKHYLSDLKIFIETLGQQAPEAVTAVDVDSFVEQQMAAGLSAATINRRLASLHTFFEYLASECPERPWPNPVVWCRHRLKMGTHLPRDVADPTVTQLFTVIEDERDQAMFGLMVGAGLRVGEVATLRLDSLNAPVFEGELARLRVCGKGDKERFVWLTPSLLACVQRWLEVRPPSASDRLFLNQRGQPITVAGIQYCLKQHCQVTGVTLSCHQLRHTFARRLAEGGLPIDSLAKLLGHNQLHTTQRYIDGADPSLRAEFKAAMAQLEAAFTHDPVPPPVVALPQPPAQPRTATQPDLIRLRERLVRLPLWLRDSVDAYLTWRWPTWRAQTAIHSGEAFISVIHRIWTWPATHRQVAGWDTFHRPDLEAWLQARYQDDVSQTTIHNEVSRLRSLLQFMQMREWSFDPDLLRVKLPPKDKPLPKYLDEADYRRLETLILRTTETDSYEAAFDRAWFLTLAHTGIRISELLDLRLDDLNLRAGYATIRTSKSAQDRVVYLTPPLIGALVNYLNQRPDLPDQDRVFLLHHRSPAGNTIRRRLSDFAQPVDLNVSPHQLRHTFATRLLNQGMSINSLRKLLRHTNLSTTQIYAQIYDTTLFAQFQSTMSQLEAIAIDDWPHTLPVSDESGITQVPDSTWNFNLAEVGLDNSV
jgi:integrase/recombinase XerC